MKIETPGQSSTESLDLGPMLEGKAGKVKEREDGIRNRYNDERNFYEIEKLKAENEKLKAEIDQINAAGKNYLKLKTTFFWICTSIAIVWIAIVAIYLIYKVPPELITTTLLISILITTTGHILGLYYIIANHLFPKSGMQNNNNI
jgi:hypothetical protein